LLGQSLREAQGTEFFTFFNLSKTNELPDQAHEGMKINIFGTNGAFKGAINLLIVTKNNSDIIQVATLMLRRDWLENPKTSPFARDIVK
jgi:hypothetical protein